MSAWIETHGEWAIPLVLIVAALSDGIIEFIARCC